MHRALRESFRVSARTACVLLLFTLLNGSEAAHSVKDSCDAPFDFVEFRFELKHAIKNERGDFVGEFEIENVRFPNEILLEGTLNNGAFSVDYPQLEIEFMDLNGTWVPFTQLPGTFMAPPNTLRLAPLAKAAFVTRLPSSEFLLLGGYKFRLLLRLSKPSICIASDPFVVIQQRGPIEGFKSARRSTKALEVDMPKGTYPERLR